MSMVNQLADRFIDWQHRTNPFLATRRGVYTYDTLVPDYSQNNLLKCVSDLEDFKEELNNINRQNLDTHQKVNWHLVDITLRQELRKLKSLKYFERDPGFVTSQLMGISYLMLSRNYAPIQERVSSLAKRLASAEQMMSENRKVIVDPPYEFTRQAITQCRSGGLKFFSVNVSEMIEAQGGEITPSFQNTLNNVLESFNRHIEWLTSILPSSNGKFAIGEAMFNEMLQKDYLMNHTADTLIEQGWELLNNTKEQMRELALEIDPAKTWSEIIEQMKNEHPVAEEVLATYIRESDKVKQFVRDHDFVDFPPNEELILIETPLHMRSLFPYAGYSGPAVFDKFQSGRFWVTPVEPDWSNELKEQKLREHMYYKIPVFVLHEGYPGHHLQITTQHNLPEGIRKIMHNNLFCEGWAFYCEELLENLGYIKHPKTRLSRLKDQLWRASRIIIDASLHTERMTFAEAVQFLIDQAHLEELNAVAEVSRYIKNPLRPMSYLMGKLEILDIAEEYKRRKGKSYSLKQFHNELLQLGAIPPALVREELFAAK